MCGFSILKAVLLPFFDHSMFSMFHLVENTNPADRIKLRSYQAFLHINKKFYIKLFEKYA